MKFIQSILLVSILLTTLSATAQFRQLYVDTDPDNAVRQISLYSSREGYVAFTKWIGYTTDSGRSFTQKKITTTNVNPNGHTVNLTFGFGITGVKAFHKDTLLVYGDYGFVPAILYSTDQGNSFTLIYLSTLNTAKFTDGITDMVFPQNSQIGYATEADRIIKTTDRGKTWSVVHTAPNSFYERISAVDDNTVYIHNKEFTDRKLVATTNGGTNWSTLSLPLAGRLNAASFTAAGKGWINMNDNEQATVFYTGNNGTSWRSMTDPAAVSLHFSEMTFTGNGIGYALTGQNGVWKTDDSGKVWQPLPGSRTLGEPGYGHTRLFVPGADTIWAGGEHGLLELSTNGGGIPFPKAFFTVDTTNYLATGTVALINRSHAGYQYRWFVNNQPAGTAFNTTYTHDVRSFTDSVTLIVTHNGISDTAKKYVYFPTLTFPVVNAFSPTHAGRGSQVTITGAHFSNVTAVSFGGVPATSFSILADNTILAIVANDASGRVKVANSYSDASLAGFTYLPEPAAAAPVITGFTPAAGNTGTSVTIAGTGFGSTPAQNLVYFGTIKATITTANATSIVCQVPAGAIYADIKVLNTTTSLSGVSAKPFAVTFADSTNFTGNSFKRILSFASEAPRFPHANVGDVDGDGKPDILFGTAFRDDSVHVYLNASQGSTISFAPKKNISLLASNNVRVLRDIDNDGKADLITVNDNKLHLIRNTSTPGNLNFENNLTFTNAGMAGPADLAMEDLDGDGRPDLAIAGFNNKTLWVVRNTSWPGYISFAAASSYAYTDDANPRNIALADMDGDNHKDIVLLNFHYSSTNKSSLSYFKNTSTPGHISFADKTNVEVNGSASQFNSLQLRDYDGDGRPDVIVCNDNYLQVFLNTSTTGNFSLAAPVVFENTPGLMGLSVANFSGAVQPDIATGSFGYRRLSLFRNQSIPGVVKNDPRVDWEPGTINMPIPYLTLTADLNGDARPDVIASAPNSNEVVVFENKLGIPIDTLVCIGSEVTLNCDIAATNWQWQVNTGSGYVNVPDNTIYAGARTAELHLQNVPASMNSYRYRCISGNSISSIYRLKVAGPVKPDATITTGSPLFCKNGTVTFTATVAGNQQPFRYIWQVNEQDVHIDEYTNEYKTTALRNNDRVRAIVLGGDRCSTSEKDTSNVIVMLEKGTVPAVSITAQEGIVCVDSLVTFTATPVNGGTAPVYQWLQNNNPIGSNSPVLKAAVPHLANIRVTMTSNASECNIAGTVHSNTINKALTANTVNAVSISTPATAICANQPVTFTANSANFDPTAGMQWLINDVVVAQTGTSYTASNLANGSTVKVLRTTTQPCTLPVIAQSNIITLQTSPTLVPAVTISGQTDLQEGQSSTITATAINSGTAPTYQWEDSVSVNGWLTIGAESTTPSISFKPLMNGHKLRVTMKSNASCASVAAVTSTPLTFAIQKVTAIDPIDPSTLGITWFPNPVHAELNIRPLRIGELWETLEIKTIDGKHVLALSVRNKASITINVSTLQAGWHLAILRRRAGAPVYIKFIKL